jgi:hypothetical protein
MELNITELRRQKRPLWMTDFNEESFAQMLGGGGDVWTDRLPSGSPRITGAELTDDEEKELGPISLKKFKEPE